MWGGKVLFGIDNHFQLLLYTNENHCQLETIKNDKLILRSLTTNDFSYF
ncbi:MULTISPECIES: hypothetical protein [Staphylococcus]|nr:MULTISPECIES: hypothetical protein [Staphylococcus]